MSLKSDTKPDLVDYITKSHHPTKGQDTDCPKIEWMGEDLNHCPGIGEWKCKLQEDIDPWDHTKDYKKCNCSDYKKCPVYLKK